MRNGTTAKKNETYIKCRKITLNEVKSINYWQRPLFCGQWENQPTTKYYSLTPAQDKYLF